MKSIIKMLVVIRAVAVYVFLWVMFGFNSSKVNEIILGKDRVEKILKEQELKQKDKIKKGLALTVIDQVNKGNMNKDVEQRLYPATAKPDIIDVVENNLGDAFKIKDVDSGKVVYEKNIYKDMLVEVDEYLNDALHVGIKKGHFIHKKIKEVLENN